MIHPNINKMNWFSLEFSLFLMAAFQPLKYIIHSKYVIEGQVMFLHITQQFSISFLFFACFCYSCSFHFKYLFIFSIHNWFFPPPSSLASIFISSSSPERPCKNKTTTSRHETSLITFCFIIILFVAHRRDKNKVRYLDTQKLSPAAVA